MYDPDRYVVGYYVYGIHTLKLVTVATVESPQAATRLARRWRNYLIKVDRWPTPEGSGWVVACRVGGGTIFDYDFFVPVGYNRRYYRRMNYTQEVTAPEREGQ